MAVVPRRGVALNGAAGAGKLKGNNFTHVPDRSTPQFRRLWAPCLVMEGYCLAFKLRRTASQASVESVLIGAGFPKEQRGR